MRVFARAAWRAWWESRHQRTDQWVLTQRNVYILPTAAGWVFAAMVVVLLIASINYQLSLGYLLTFLLAGAGFASMHQTHNNLRGLVLHVQPPVGGWAGHAHAPLALDIDLYSPSRPRWGLGLGLSTERFDAAVHVDAARDAHTVAHLRWTPPQRGRLHVPTLKIETRFPLGLFRAWTLWRPATPIVAWPALETPAPPLPPPTPLGGEAASLQVSSGGEFDGVRPHRTGDSQRQIVWKKVARGGPDGELVSRDTRESQRRELWLEPSLSGLSLADGGEAALSRLAAWIVHAHAQGVACGLRLGEARWSPQLSGQHRRAMLDALAQWSPGRPASSTSMPQ